MRNIATHLAVLAIGVAAGIGGVAAAANNTGTPRAHSSASDTRIVNELRDLNRSVKLMNRSISGYDDLSARPSVAESLHAICRNTRPEGTFSGC
jgi:hypothetical protein